MSAPASPPHLIVDNFGPIKHADVEFGDLNVFVGPQASGKSIFLQLLKLLLDAPQVKGEFELAGVDWASNFNTFMDAYFGEGMHSLWDRNKTKVTFNDRETDLSEMVEETKASKESQSMFYIPAQRVMAFYRGWPQPFSYYDPGVPFTLRKFSETLRPITSILGPIGKHFPNAIGLKYEYGELLRKHIFHGFSLNVDTVQAQKRLVLSSERNGKGGLPYAVWSSGQREFVPLLIGLYVLTFQSDEEDENYDWAVIEEPEMGLHPRAISVVLWMIFDLVAQGYRVCISTHSSQVLDAMWALKHLRENGANPASLLEVFDVPKTEAMLKVASDIIGKTPKVYYFDRESGNTRDISELNLDAEEEGEANWGGISEFSGRANEAVARAVANANR